MRTEDFQTLLDSKSTICLDTLLACDSEHVNCICKHLHIQTNDTTLNLDGTIFNNPTVNSLTQLGFSLIDAGELIEWLSSVQKEAMTKSELIRATCVLPDYSKSIPYQNNGNSIKKMATTLLCNRKRILGREKSLVSNGSYFGFGKTRLGVQFQIYIDLRSVPKGSDDIERAIIANIIKSTNGKYEQPYDLAYIYEWISKLPINIYLIIDELGTLFNGQEDLTFIAESYYTIWNECLMKLLLLNNVYLYTCGKGALFELLRRGCFKGNYTNCPSLLFTPQLQSIKYENILNILQDIEYKHQPTVKYLIENNILKQFAEEIHSKTGGIPILVQSALLTLKDIQISYTIDQLRVEVDEAIQPIAVAMRLTEDLGKTCLYSFFMWSSVLNKCFECSKNVSLKDYIDLEEFKGLLSVKIIDMSNFCNVYTEIFTAENNKEMVRFLFPKILFDCYYLKEDDDISHIYNICKQYPNLRKEELLEYIVPIRISMVTLIHQDQSFGTKFPFLKRTPIENVSGVINWQQSNRFGKFTRNSSKIEHISNQTPVTNECITWPEVINHVDTHPLEMFTFDNESYSPDCLFMTRLSNHEIYNTAYVCIQKVNNYYGQVDFITIKEEVDKTLPLLEKVNSTSCVILIVLPTVKGCDLEPGVYTNEEITTEQLPNEENTKIIMIPENFYLVVPISSDFKKLVGQWNFKAISNFNEWKKDVVDIKSTFDMIIPKKEKTKIRKL